MSFSLGRSAPWLERFLGRFSNRRRLFGSRTCPVPMGACPAGRCVPAVPECLVPLGARRAGSQGPVTKQMPPSPGALDSWLSPTRPHTSTARTRVPGEGSCRAWHRGRLSLESVRLSLQALCVTAIFRVDVHPGASGVSFVLLTLKSLCLSEVGLFISEAVR